MLKKDIFNYQTKTMQQLKEEHRPEREYPFMVTCIDNTDFYCDGQERKESTLMCLQVGKDYTVEKSEYTRTGRELRKIGKGFYPIDRFIIV